MMIYLTGANTSLVKSSEAAQTDPAKSLGGYISSTPVPNGELNALFDLISSHTLEKKKKETIALGLVNKLDKAVNNVTLKVVVGNENLATFRVAAVKPDNYLAMEHIANRYAEPLAADFYSADFQRASVDIEITNPASMGEEIALYPFNVVAEVEESGIEGTWNAFENAFSNDETYDVIRISEKRFRVLRSDENVLNEPISCSYVATDSFSCDFVGKFANGSVGEVTIIDEDSQLNPGEAVGLWIQRDLKKYKYPTNQQLIEDYKNKVIKETIETAEIVISYNILNAENNYSDDYNKESYS